MKTHRSAPSKQDHGFTLLELIIAFAILAMTSVIAMPLLSRSAGEAALAATARKLASDMHVARASAIRDNAERTLIVNLAERRFHVDGLTAPSGIGNEIAINFSTLKKELASNNSGRIRFFPDGSSTGGTVTLSTGGRTVTVELNWMTGHATVRRSR